jgi:NAD(P)-dependent dehydrogenase (short-subunit alcohol dehydrogenase family)
VNLKDRVVVVTGGTAGVGRATVRAFAAEGARIGVIARDQDRLERTMRELLDAGAPGLGVAADVADAKEVDRAAEAFERDLGPIDIWVNNAMTSIFAPFIEIEPEEFKRVTEVTYLGFVYGTYAALSRMVPRDQGVIVQVGSALTERGIPLQSAYCGAKHAVQGFTESVRCELLHDHSRVRIGLVQLPALNTPHFDWALSRLPRRAQPVPPIYQPEIAARGIVQFAKHNRREVWVGWATTRAIAANRVAPGILDRYLGRSGFDSQQTEEPEQPDRPNNLWRPVRADVDAHGRFDDRAKGRSPALWASLHRRVVLFVAAAAAIALVATTLRILT